jgi:hypothetical protein
LGCCYTSKGSRPRYSRTSRRRGLLLPFSSEHDGADYGDAVRRARAGLTSMAGIRGDRCMRYPPF